MKRRGVLPLVVAGMLLVTVSSDARGQSRDAFPRQYVGWVEGSQTSVDNPPVKWTWVANVRFTLDKVEHDVSLGVRTTYYWYRVSGTLRVTLSGGACRYHGRGTFRIRARHPDLLIWVVRRPGRAPRAQYSASGEYTDSQLRHTLECSPGDVRPGATYVPHWLHTSIDTGRCCVTHRIGVGAKTLNGEFDYTEGPPGDNTRQTYRWCFSSSGGCPEEPLHADPGGPYEVRRADSVTLDASSSRGNITRYRWTFSPGGDCPKRVKLANSTTTGSGPELEVTLLCSLRVKLTISDAKGRTDSASATIRVLPRVKGFRTPDVEHTDVADEVRLRDPAHWDRDVLLGANVSACAALDSEDPLRADPFLCPSVSDASGESGRGKQYFLDLVDDPGGPFHRFFYVASAPLTIKRLGLLNARFLPGGASVDSDRGQPSFWEYNKDKADVEGFRAALRAHEGMGVPGRLETGHSGRLQALIVADNRENDPRRMIEDELDHAEKTLEAKVESELLTFELRAGRAIVDPLPEIWRGTMWLYDSDDFVWRTDVFPIGGVGG